MGGNWITASQLSEWAQLVTSIAVLVSAIVAGIVAIFGLRRVVTRLDETVTTTTAIHEEVKTINGRTLAQLADADETRRVEGIPKADRTEQETEHVVAVPPGSLGTPDAPPSPA